MDFIFNDGGRAEAGFKGHTSDCAARAIAIATGLPYQRVYDDLNMIAKKERKGTRKKSTSNSRLGVYRYTYEKYLKSLGWIWVSTSGIGKGFQAHLSSDELPKGRLIVMVRSHLTTVIDHVINDTWNPGSGIRYSEALDDWVKPGVYGYYHKP